MLNISVLICNKCYLNQLIDICIEFYKLCIRFVYSNIKKF